MYNLRFLGGASIKGPEGPVIGPAVQPRRLALLACLAVAKGQPVSRDKLIAMLWPESAPESARHSVRETVYVLNHELKDAPVEVVGNGLRIDPERCPSDVALFQTAIESGDLERAVQLYRGEFLDGLFLRDALEFEEWAREERERFSRVYAQALEELAENAAQHGDYLQAVSWLRDLVVHDPYSGRATVRLMESLAATGDRAEALRQADAHAVQMREAFDAAPDGAVTELADRLREEPTKGRAGTAATVKGRRVALRQPIRRRWLPAAVVAPILGLAVWYMALKDDGRGQKQAPGATAAPSIAVLPFSVRGEELAVLREGMVDLLSTGLDGAGGLRAIPASTLLARWREYVPSEEIPGLTTALEVARRSRAQYALVGSVVAIDSDVRIMVGIYDVNADKRLGQAQVEGSPDNVLPLVDELAVEVLRIVLQRGEEELPEIDLANLTSRSPEALRAFLEGEVHYRHFDLIAARDAYIRALEADSTLALAHHRLYRIYGWRKTLNSTLAHQHGQRAVQLVDRLPSRQAILVKAIRSMERGTLEWVGSLRNAVRIYPEDAEAWFQLAEGYLHAEAAMATQEEIDQAFQRAVELDPRNGRNLYHHVQFAWKLHADSVRAARLLDMFERVAPDHPLAPAGLLALDLAFGDSAAQVEAMARLRTEDLDVLNEAAQLLYHPRYSAHPAPWRELLERGNDSQREYAAILLFYDTARWRGRLRDGLPYLNDPAMSPGFRARASYQALTTGLPIPEEILERALDPAAIDSVAQEWTVFFAGAFAADRGRWSDHARAIAELQRRTTRAFEQADSTAGLRLTGRAGALEGYALWRRGQPAAAVTRLEDPKSSRMELSQWWLGQLYQELGRFRDAERVYRSYGRISTLSIEPLSQRQLGKIYEQLEEYDKARESYEYFVEYWKNADPELQPIVEEARQAIIRLEGLQRG